MTLEQREECCAFRQLRLSYLMTQQEFSTATGIDIKVIRLIEKKAIVCSESIKSKLRDFVIDWASKDIKTAI